MSSSFVVLTFIWITTNIICKDQFWLGLQNMIGFRPNKPKQWICRASEKELAWIYRKCNNYGWFGRVIIRIKYKTHPWPSQNSIIKYLEFFLLVSYFLRFFLSILFSPSFVFGHLFMLYTIIFVPFPLYTCKSGYRSFSLSHLTPLWTFYHQL